MRRLLRRKARPIYLALLPAFSPEASSKTSREGVSRVRKCSRKRSRKSHGIPNVPRDTSFCARRAIETYSRARGIFRVESSSTAQVTAQGSPPCCVARSRVAYKSRVAVLFPRRRCIEKRVEGVFASVVRILGRCRIASTRMRATIYIALAKFRFGNAS